MKNSYALVTGASSGLGRDFAILLAGAGYNLVLTARREERLMDLKRELSETTKSKVEIIAMDLTASNAAEHLYQETRKRGLEVEVLINNAGYGIYGMFEDIAWEREAQMIQLDMVALTHLTKLYSKDMAARGKGYILLISSIGAYQATPTYAAYAAAKSYVLHLGEALNFEMASRGVKISVLSPGITATEFLQVSGQETTLYQRLAMMQSRPVAEIGLKAMFKGKPSVVPGILNKLSAFSIRFIPRRLATYMSYLLMRNNEQSAAKPV